MVIGQGAARDRAKPQCSLTTTGIVYHEDRISANAI